MALWSDENKARVADMLKRGMSAGQIGAALGMTRNAIIGVVGRDRELAAIGFARSPSRGTYIKPKTARKTPEPTEKPKRQRTKVLENAAKCGTISVPVIDLNEAVDQWIQANNGVRRFNRGDSADFFRVQDFLKSHGYDVTGSPQRREFKVDIDGRKKSVGWIGLLQFADSIRVQSGLEPILASSRR